MNHVVRHGKGFSLLDLLLATALTISLVALAPTIAGTAVVDARRRRDAAQAEEGAISALEMMARELRGAGFSAAPGVDPLGLVVARSDHLEVRSDFDGDGSSEDSYERVVYAYRPTTRQLSRASGRGNLQAVVDAVPPGGLTLRYFDAAGAELATPPEGLPEAARRAVRRIDVALAVALPPHADGATSQRLSFQSSIALRNP